MSYRLLENWPLWNTAGDSKQPEQKEQRQGNDSKGSGEGGERETEAGFNNTRAPFQVAAEDRRGRSRAVASETLTDPSPGEMQEEMQIVQKGTSS